MVLEKKSIRFKLNLKIKNRFKATRGSICDNTGHRTSVSMFPLRLTLSGMAKRC